MKTLICVLMILSSYQAIAGGEKVKCREELERFNLSQSQIEKSCKRPQAGLCQADMMDVDYSLVQAEKFCQDPKVGRCMADLVRDGYRKGRLKDLCTHKIEFFLPIFN